MFSKLRRLVSKKSTSIILMYHRVCDRSVDPWQLSVSPGLFEEQVRILTQSFEVLPLPDLFDQLREKRIEGNKVYVTFDDGYTDNYEFAKPILEKYKCPATFFIPSFFTGKKQQFWWDELLTISFKTTELPPGLKLPIDGKIHDIKVPTGVPSTEELLLQREWHWPDPPPTNRCQLYLDLYFLLQRLQYNEISEAMCFLRTWSNTLPAPENIDFPMNQDQLLAFAENELFDIGLHTHTHILLNAQSPIVQENDIISNWETLVASGCKPINAIAYPHGGYNERTEEILKECKIDIGLTTSATAISKNSSRYGLGRIHVKSQDGPTFIRSIRELC